MDLAKRWRQKPAYYRLEGQRHRHTGAIRFPPQPPRVGESGEEWEAYPLQARAKSIALLGYALPLPSTRPRLRIWWRWCASMRAYW